MRRAGFVERAVLMPLSTGRWPTWLEMFPGVTEDSLSPAIADGSLMTRALATGSLSAGGD